MRLGTADAEIRVPSAKNTELTELVCFKPEQLRVYSSTRCFACCQELCRSNFCLFRYIQLHFVSNLLATLSGVS